MDKEKPPRLNNNELLGNYMISAGNEFGPGASYGKIHNYGQKFFKDSYVFRGFNKRWQPELLLKSVGLSVLKKGYKRLEKKYCIMYLAGSALVKCGVTQRKLGEAERDFMQKTMSHFLYPLKNFLEGDMKTISVRFETTLFTVLLKGVTWP